MEHVKNAANKKACMEQLIKGMLEIEKEELSESASDALEIEQESLSESGLEMLNTTLVFKHMSRMCHRELLMS